MSYNYDVRYATHLLRLFKFPDNVNFYISACYIPIEYRNTHPTNFPLTDLYEQSSDRLLSFMKYTTVIKFYLMFVTNKNKARVSDFEISLWNRMDRKINNKTEFIYVAELCGITKEVFDEGVKKYNLQYSTEGNEYDPINIYGRKCILVTILEKHNIPHTVYVNNNERTLINYMINKTNKILLPLDEIRKISLEIYKPNIEELNGGDRFIDGNAVDDFDA